MDIPAECLRLWALADLCSYGSPPELGLTQSISTWPCLSEPESDIYGFSGSVSHRAFKGPRFISRTTLTTGRVEISRKMSELGDNAAFMMDKAVGCLRGCSEISRK